MGKDFPIFTGRRCGACGAHTPNGQFCGQCGAGLKRTMPLKWFVLMGLIIIPALAYLLISKKNPIDVQGLKTSHAVVGSTSKPDASMDRVDQLIAQSSANRSGLEEAIRLLDDLTKAYPAYSYAWRLKANLLSGMGRHSEAIESYQAYLALNPEDMKVGVSFGKVLIRKKRFDEAIEQFDKVVLAHPDYWEGWLLLGRAYEGKGDLEKAEELGARAQAVKEANGVVKLPFMMHPRILKP